MKNFIFDFDGTLIDSESFFEECFDYALKPFHEKIDVGFVERVRHVHPSKIFDDLLGKDRARIAIERLSKKGAEVVGKMKPFEGVVDLLEELTDLGISMAVWTGRDGNSARAILEETNLSQYFKSLVSGTCVENNKPKHDGLIQIVDSFGGDYRATVVVGDHTHDIMPANELDCISVHACWKKNPHDLHKGIEAKFKFEKVQNLQSWAKAQVK